MIEATNMNYAVTGLCVVGGYVAGVVLAVHFPEKIFAEVNRLQNIFGQRIDTELIPNRVECDEEMLAIARQSVRLDTALHKILDSRRCDVFHHRFCSVVTEHTDPFINYAGNTEDVFVDCRRKPFCIFVQLFHLLSILRKSIEAVGNIPHPLRDFLIGRKLLSVEDLLELLLTQNELDVNGSKNTQENAGKSEKTVNNDVGHKEDTI